MTYRASLLVVLAVSAAISSSSHAFAWGCVAEAEDGASGWSNNYSSKSAANKRAMAECNAKTDEPCEITDCNQDW